MTQGKPSARPMFDIDDLLLSCGTQELQEPDAQQGAPTLSTRQPMTASDLDADSDADSDSDHATSDDDKCKALAVADRADRALARDDAPPVKPVKPYDPNARNALPVEEEIAWNAILPWADQLRDRLQGKPLCIRYGSDCSGGEAPLQAWMSIARVCKHLKIADISLVHEWASEHPAAKFVHRFLQQNTPVRRLFRDVHLRTPSGGPVIFADPDIDRDSSSGHVRLPSAVDLYCTGFECQDLSVWPSVAPPLSRKWQSH